MVAMGSDLCFSVLAAGASVKPPFLGVKSFWRWGQTFVFRFWRWGDGSGDGVRPSFFGSGEGSRFWRWGQTFVFRFWRWGDGGDGVRPSFFGSGRRSECQASVLGPEIEKTKVRPPRARPPRAGNQTSEGLTPLRRSLQSNRKEVSPFSERSNVTVCSQPERELRRPMR
jgi:hypothetical protein